MFIYVHIVRHCLNTGFFQLESNHIPQTWPSWGTPVVNPLWTSGVIEPMIHFYTSKRCLWRGLRRLFAQGITCSIFCTNGWLMVKAGALGFYADQERTLYQRGFRILKPLTREDSQTSKLPTLTTNSNYLLSVFDPRFLLLVVRFGSRIWFDQIVVRTEFSVDWSQRSKNCKGRSLAGNKRLNALVIPCGNDLEPLGWNTLAYSTTMPACQALKTPENENFMGVSSQVPRWLQFCIGWKWTCRGGCQNNKDLQEIHSLVEMCRYAIIQSYAYIMCITCCIYIYIYIQQIGSYSY